MKAVLLIFYNTVFVLF